jgi:tetrahydromethanopterin S-methyltransferase subunit B
MLSNNFWYGFVIGVGLVFLVFLVTKLIARAKKGDDS